MSPWREGGGTLFKRLERLFCMDQIFLILENVLFGGTSTKLSQTR